MTQRIRSANRRGDCSFTVVVMMVVVATITILMTVGIPMYNRFIVEAKETVLHNTLLTLRSAIDSYAHDKEKGPQSIRALVAEGYLLTVPMDPMVGNNQSWHAIMEDAAQSVNQSGHLRRKIQFEQNGPVRYALFRLVEPVTLIN